MVVDISTIPLHLQKQIAEKMEFLDLKKFHGSSKRGRYLSAVVKPIMKGCFISIAMDYINVRIHHAQQVKRWKSVSLSAAKKNANCPRFRGRIIIEEPITNERMVEVIREIEQGHFTGSKVNITKKSLVESVSTELFVKFIEVSNATTIVCAYFEPRVMELPMLHKMDVYLTSIRAKDLLELKSPRIQVSVDESVSNSTLNQLFKQWLHGHRKMGNLIITTRNTQFKVEELFSGLSFSIVWPKETENSKIRSILSAKQIEIFNKKSAYSLHNGEKSLFIFVSGRTLQAKEVLDVEEEFEKYVTALANQQLTAFDYIY